MPKRPPPAKLPPLPRRQPAEPAPPPFADEPADDAHFQSGIAMWHAAASWRRALREAVGPLGLTPAQFFVLTTLVRVARGTGDGVNQRELAEHARMDQSTLSKLLLRLDDRALIDRDVDAMGRAWNVLPTDRGRALLETATISARLAAHRFFSALGDEVPNVRSALEQLIR